MQAPTNESPTKPPISFWELVLLGLGVGVAVSVFKSGRRSRDVRHGFEQEKKIARGLERKGADVELSPGSRGPHDLRADFGEETWLIQAKSSRRGQAKVPSPKERQNLIAAAKRQGAKPVVALSDSGRTTFFHAKSGERLKPKKIT